MRSIKACAAVLLACIAASASAQAPEPFATLGFACAEQEAGAPGCSVGERQLALDIFDQGAGEIGLRLSNQGELRGTITEVYMMDEAGLLRAETADVEGTGQVHFRKATKARPFPSSSAAAEGEQQEALADLALRRRKEISRLGRFMRSNGVDNAPGDALTVRMKTTNDALDAELVADASHECLLRVAVVMTGFKEDPKAKRTFFSACPAAGKGK